ncbi:MAG TPA: hypothetical protein HA277_05730 [Methanosphaera sp.]|nr:hypothetical protein [Methanosphaera sp.]
MKKKILLIISVVTLFLLNTVSAVDYETNDTQIKLIINNHETTAKMIKNPTSDEFLSLLPLNVELKDLFGREKYAALPTKITDNSQKTDTYSVGMLAYYEPTNSIAIYYENDNEKIKEGIIPLAIIEDVEAFKENNTNLTIELIE